MRVLTRMGVIFVAIRCQWVHRRWCVRRDLTSGDGCWSEARFSEPIGWSEKLCECSHRTSVCPSWSVIFILQTRRHWWRRGLSWLLRAWGRRLQLRLHGDWNFDGGSRFREMSWSAGLDDRHRVCKSCCIAVPRLCSKSSVYPKYGSQIKSGRRTVSSCTRNSLMWRLWRFYPFLPR